MAKFITYVIMVAATLYMAILYGSESFLMLFYVELLLPAALMGTILPVTKKLRIKLFLPVNVTEQGKKVSLRMKIQNTSRVPLVLLSVQMACTLPMETQSKKVWFYKRLPGAGGGEKLSTEIRGEYTANTVGNVQLEITGVWCQDILGLVKLPVPKKLWQGLEPENLLVLPKICEMPVQVSRQSRDYAGEGEEYSRKKGGDDPSEVFQVRDYQPGDKLRSIHWKLSAKTEGLMVREYSMPLGCPVEFYLDLYYPGKKWKKMSKKRDSYLQIVASVSHSLAVEGCRHHVIWYDVDSGDISRVRVETAEDVYRMLSALGKLTMSTKKQDLAELYRKKYHENAPVTRLVLGADLTLYHNGERWRQFSGDLEQIDRQLGERELTV